MARNDLSESTLGCLIGGAGPAGLGFLFNAIKRGALEQLAQAGTIIVDAGTELGAGKLGDYQIIANSVSDVFLDCLRDPLLAPILAPLQASPTFRHLKLNSQEAPALPIVGQLFQQAAGLVLPWLERQYGIPTLQEKGADLAEIMACTDEILGDGRLLPNCPRDVTREDVEFALHGMYAG